MPGSLVWHQHADLTVEFGRGGCGHHDHNGTTVRHYHYVSGARIDYVDGTKHRSIRAAEAGSGHASADPLPEA